LRYLGANAGTAELRRLAMATRQAKKIYK
jgi:hypothetical protein